MERCILLITYEKLRRCTWLLLCIPEHTDVWAYGRPTAVEIPPRPLHDARTTHDISTTSGFLFGA